MNRTPKISVVTISYNQGQYITDNIESVLAQNYPDFEHIIVDGGSKDNTKEICSRYPHVKFIDAPGTSQTEALNIGFKEAKGDIIAWLNSDDYYEPNIFHRVTGLLNSGCDTLIITGDAKVVDADKKLMWNMRGKPAPFHRLLFHARLYRIDGRMCMPCQPATFFHRKILDQLGPLVENLNFGMDYEYWLRMLAAGYKFKYIPEMFANYRYHLSSKTVKDGYDRFLSEWSRISKQYYSKMPLHRKILAELNWLILLAETFLFHAYKALTRIEAAPAPPHQVPALTYPQNPLVSVIIPMFNSGKYITATIQSVLNQTYQNYEIIIVDDGSTDNSLKIASEFAARHNDKIKILQHEGGANRGVAASRNLAISRAKGELIAFLDADDLWNSDKIYKQVEFMKAHPEVRLSYSRATVIREGKGADFMPGEEIIGNPPPPDPKITLFQVILVQVNYIFSSVMVSTGAIRAIGGFVENLPFQSEDRIMTAMICSRYPIAMCDEILCQYRAHSESYTASVVSGRLPPAIFYDMQVRIMKWLINSDIKKDWARDIAYLILPISFVRATSCTLNVKVQTIVYRDFITSLLYFPGIPLKMAGRLLSFLCKGIAHGNLFSRALDLISRTAPYKAIFGSKPKKENPPDLNKEK